MKIKKYKHSEKGFVIVLALTMLVAMSLLAATILTLATKEHVKNAEKDTRQQAFYAAETGITEAKRWLAENSDTVTNSSPSPLAGNLIFCNNKYDFKCIKIVIIQIYNKILMYTIIIHVNVIVNTLIYYFILI